MTNDEADWLADFLETAQKGAKQAETTAAKDYAAKLRLLTPRFNRAQAGDAEGELAPVLAQAEDLLAKKKYDDASDALTKASAIAFRIVSTPVEEPMPEPEPAEPEPLVEEELEAVSEELEPAAALTESEAEVEAVEETL